MESIGHDFNKYVDFVVQRKLSFPPLYQAAMLLVGTVALYFIADAINNLFFHPLANVPGPLINRISKIPWV